MSADVSSALTVDSHVIVLFDFIEEAHENGEPLKKAGWLTIATSVTFLFVPAVYAIFVLELKLVKWDVIERNTPEPETHPPVAAT